MEYKHTVVQQSCSVGGLSVMLRDVQALVAAASHGNRQGGRSCRLMLRYVQDLVAVASQGNGQGSPGFSCGCIPG